MVASCSPVRFFLRRGVGAGLVHAARGGLRVDGLLDRGRIPDEPDPAVDDAGEATIRGRRQRQALVAFLAHCLALEGGVAGDTAVGRGRHQEALGRSAALGVGKRCRVARDEDRSVEPWLDVRGVVDRTVGSGVDEAAEGLIDLRVQRRLVGESREVREQVAELLQLVAGQVEAGLDDHRRIGRHVAQRLRRGRAAEHQHGDAGHCQHDGDHAQPEGPAKAVAGGPAGARGGAHDRIHRRARCTGRRAVGRRRRGCHWGRRGRGLGVGRRCGRVAGTRSLVGARLVVRHIPLIAVPSGGRRACRVRGRRPSASSLAGSP